ncbi:ABC transporter permease [Candidatus Latescibacterota bacterium]
MGYITEGLAQALHLLATGDPDTYSAILTTVKVSSLSIAASLVLGAPIGFLLGYFDFPAKKQIRAVFDTLLAFPTVLVGLIVYALISQRGPLGDYGLLFTIPGIAVAQTVLVTPIVISLTATAIEGLDRRFKMTIHTLGARGSQSAIASFREVQSAVLAAAVTAYGRAISEVGISMMIGGNIKWHTRTITTAIALETGRGAFATGIALGMVLLVIAFLVNWSLTLLKRSV